MINVAKAEEAIKSLIEAIGEDPQRKELKQTPNRVARMYVELFSGLDQDPKEILKQGFEERHQGLIVFKDIPFCSMCEHHLLPFYGHAHLGYIPNGLIVGASKMARALDILARRPQLQERLTSQLADTIFEALQPQGIAVVLQAEHLCMTIRGVKKAGSTIVTEATRGILDQNSAPRAEFFGLLRGI